MIEALESILGEIDGGWPTSHPDVQLVKFNAASDRYRTFSTLGLHRHALMSEAGSASAIELLVRINDAGDFQPLLSALQDVAELCLADHLSPRRGEVFGPRGPIYHGSNLTALYVSQPFFLSPPLHALDAHSTTLWWLVPITSAEASKAKSSEPSAFESYLKGLGNDVFDLARGSTR